MLFEFFEQVGDYLNFYEKVSSIKNKLTFQEKGLGRGEPTLEG